MLLGGVVWRLRAARAGEARSRARLAALLEVDAAGLAVWSAGGRLVACNGRFREFYPEVTLKPGLEYEDLVRYTATRAVVMVSEAEIGAWIEERLDRRGEPATETLRTPDGRVDRDAHVPDGRGRGAPRLCRRRRPAVGGDESRRLGDPGSGAGGRRAHAAGGHRPGPRRRVVSPGGPRRGEAFWPSGGIGTRARPISSRPTAVERWFRRACGTSGTTRRCRRRSAPPSMRVATTRPTRCCAAPSRPPNRRGSGTSPSIRGCRMRAGSRSGASGRSARSRSRSADGSSPCWSSSAGARAARRGPRTTHRQRRRSARARLRARARRAGLRVDRERTGRESACWNGVVLRHDWTFECAVS